MKHIFRGFNFLELSLDERVMQPMSYCSASKARSRPFRSRPTSGQRLVEQLSEVGNIPLAA